MQLLWEHALFDLQWSTKTEWEARYSAVYSEDWEMKFRYSFIIRSILIHVRLLKVQIKAFIHNTWNRRTYTINQGGKILRGLKKNFSYLLSKMPCTDFSNSHLSTDYLLFCTFTPDCVLYGESAALDKHYSTAVTPTTSRQSGALPRNCSCFLSMQVVLLDHYHLFVLFFMLSYSLWGVWNWKLLKVTAVTQTE